MFGTGIYIWAMEKSECNILKNPVESSGGSNITVLIDLKFFYKEEYLRIYKRK